MDWDCSRNKDVSLFSFLLFTWQVTLHFKVGSQLRAFCRQHSQHSSVASGKHSPLAQGHSPFSGAALCGSIKSTGVCGYIKSWLLHPNLSILASEYHMELAKAFVETASQSNFSCCSVLFYLHSFHES